jgi:hypothetical protein
VEPDAVERPRVKQATAHAASIDGSSTSYAAPGATIVDWCKVGYPRDDLRCGRDWPAQSLIVPRFTLRGP